MNKKILSIIMIIAVCLGIGATAQENTDTATRKLSKKELKAIKKKKKQQADSIAHIEAVDAIKNGVYILLVDKTMNKKIDDESRRLNFVIVENGKILVQTGVARSYHGNNNLGGLTVMSEVLGDIKLEEKKNGEVISKFRVMDNFLSGDVKVKLYKNNNYGEISILHLRTGDHITYFGNFVAFDPSMVGTAIEVGKLYSSEGWDPFTLGLKHDAGSLMDYLTGRR